MLNTDLKNIQVTKPTDIAYLKEKLEFTKIHNEAKKKQIIKQIKSWNIQKDDFKFQFFFSLIVNGYITEKLGKVINEEYKDNSDLAFKFYKENNLI